MLDNRVALRSMAEVFIFLNKGYCIEKISFSGRLIDLGLDVEPMSEQAIQRIFQRMETVQSDFLRLDQLGLVSQGLFETYFNSELYGEQVKEAHHQQMYPDDIVSLINRVNRAVGRMRTNITISEKNFIGPTTRNMVIEVLNFFELPKKKLILPSPDTTGTTHPWTLDIGIEDAAMNSLGGIDLNSANLSMMIKRDGRGVVLPLAQQDLAQLSNIEGLDPVILSIKPASETPVFTHIK